MMKIFENGINHMLVALAHEMSPQGHGRPHETDTLFVGGLTPTEGDQRALGEFALSKNYRMIHASFELGNPDAGPTGFHAILTDGVTEAIIIGNGRLWKRDRRSPSVLVFAEPGAIMKMSAKRRIVVREMKGEFHEQGYALALEALKTRAAWKPGRAPIVSTIGELPIVMDLRSLRDALAAAA